MDPTDDSEFSPAARSQAETWFRHYRIVALGTPEEDGEPTAEQLQALHVKVQILHSARHEGLTIGGPFNKKVARIREVVVWLPQPDGTYLKKDIPRPANFAAWSTSGQDMMTECTWTRYRKRIERLPPRWPEVWYVIALADDKMRAEGSERIRRHIESSIANGSPAPH